MRLLFLLFFCLGASASTERPIGVTTIRVPEPAALDRFLSDPARFFARFRPVGGTIDSMAISGALATFRVTGEVGPIVESAWVRARVSVAPVACARGERGSRVNIDFAESDPIFSRNLASLWIDLCRLEDDEIEVSAAAREGPSPGWIEGAVMRSELPRQFAPFVRAIRGTLASLR